LASDNFAFLSWNAAGLAAAGLPPIDYPIPLGAFAELLKRGDVPPLQLLAWLQLYTKGNSSAWSSLAPAMTGIARQLARAYSGVLGEIERPHWRLSLQPVDLGRAVLTIQRGEHLVAALAADSDGRTTAAHYRALDAKAVRYLIAFAERPAAGDVGMLPGTTGWLRRTSEAYASPPGSCYLSYWPDGVGLDGERAPIDGWIEQRALTPLPWAELAVELAAQVALDHDGWLDPARMPKVYGYHECPTMPEPESVASDADLSRRDRAIGALLGLAAGDALGTTLEFTRRDSRPPLTDMVGGGPFRLAPGEWTDDTSMALCLARSLLAHRALDPLDLMQRFCRWRDQGEDACTGRCFDIGATVNAALARFQRTGDPLAGSPDPETAGNGSLMRLAPVAIFWHRDAAQADAAAALQSRTTHAAPAAVDACRVFARLLVRVIAGEDKRALLEPWEQTGDLDPAVAAVVAGSWRTKDRDAIRSSGYVVHSLEAALWAVDRAGGFEEAVLLAANLGDDADTVAAIAGQLAGAIWGASGIPERWRHRLARADEIGDLAASLFAAAPASAAPAPARPAAASPAKGGNRRLFQELCRAGRLNAMATPEFDQPPPPHARPVRADRVRGMLLGLAIGDALGNTSESLHPDERRRRYGEIRDYLPNPHAGGRRVGLPSDDTQLAFWTLEHLLEHGQLDPAALARRFSERRIFGLGQSVRSFLRNYKAGQDWPEAAARSAGNGALMRIAPVLLPHLGTPADDLAIDAALCSAITHNDPGAIAASVAFVSMLWQLLAMEETPRPDWWVEAYVATARPVEGGSGYRPRGGAWAGRYQGPLWRFVHEQLPGAWAAGASALAAANAWHSGAYLLETVPTVLYLLMRHAADPERAIIRAVNDSCDNDTVAAIVGAAVGALHGEAALPQRWRDGLLGRTAADDDGRVFALLTQAERWCDG
jgi:ADP-ribosylglycohydrolase